MVRLQIDSNRIDSFDFYFTIFMTVRSFLVTQLTMMYGILNNFVQKIEVFSSPAIVVGRAEAGGVGEVLVSADVAV